MERLSKCCNADFKSYGKGKDSGYCKECGNWSVIKEYHDKWYSNGHSAKSYVIDEASDHIADTSKKVDETVERVFSKSRSTRKPTPTTKDGQAIDDVLDTLLCWLPLKTTTDAEEMAVNGYVKSAEQAIEAYCATREMIAYINGRKDARKDLSDYIADEYVDTVTVEREADLQAQSGSKEESEA